VADDGSPLVLALLGDLMLESRVDGVSRRLGLRFRSVAQLSALPAAIAEETPAAIVLDLASPAFPLEPTLEAIHGAGGQARVIAFFPHVQKSLGEAASAAGCTTVVPRSRFVAELQSLIEQAVRQFGEFAADRAL
jgi:DNA-binding NarL/FixJ family response regulator